MSDTDVKKNRASKAPLGSLVRLPRTVQTIVLAVFVVGVLLTFGSINPAVYLSPINLQSMAYAVPEIGMLALATSIAMASGGIDLSIVAIANLAAFATGGSFIALSEAGYPEPVALGVAVVAGVLTGAVCGAINGFLIARVGIAPILATLATMQLFAGFALVVSKGQPVYGFPESYLDFGTATFAVIPLIFWLFLLAAVVVYFMMTRMRLGFQIVMFGSNRDATFYSGIRSGRVIVATYVISGIAAAIAGLLMSMRSGSATADYGSSYLLLAITIAVLGGTSPTGGKVAIFGTVLAALLLQFLSSGLNMVHVSPYIYQIAQGAILAIVLAIELKSGRLAGLLKRGAANLGRKPEDSRLERNES